MDVGWLGMVLAERGSFARANKARVDVFQKKKKKLQISLNIVQTKPIILRNVSPESGIKRRRTFIEI